VEGVQVLHLRAPRTKDINYVQRTIAELVMPFAMLRCYRKSPLADVQWDGVLWYSPSIFHGPLVSALKKRSRCNGYLIIRELFPEWAVDVGVMGRGLQYHFFNAVARYQYSVADVIGVQTPGNCAYFDRWQQQPGRRLEVLKNWLGIPAQVRCIIRVNETPLAGRKILVYAGNMGVAQGMDMMLDLAEAFNSRSDIGFLFVGRGSEVGRLKLAAKDRQLENTWFCDEISPDEIPDLYAQCSAGIVALDSRHKSHNIPGKFLTYIQSGLPVLANINAGNDLGAMIRTAEVGQVCESNQLIELVQLAEKLLIQIEQDSDLSSRCRYLFKSEFAVENTVRQIVSALAAERQSI
jgi:glycosyltransferase involved in cell wall biosynthesis